jgi:hypothetical protein
MTIKYTNWLQFIPNGHKIYHHFPFQGPSKFTQTGIFGLKTNHLATLPKISATSVILKKKKTIAPIVKNVQSGHSAGQFDATETCAYIDCFD